MARTEILRLRLRMTSRAGRKARNAGSFLRKELPDRAEDRSERIDAPILRRLTAPPAGRALRCSFNVQAMLTY